MFDEILKNYLTVYWLRPATALQRAIECEVIRKYENLRNGVSLELACGDGVNTFLRCGGVVNFSFDAFQGVRYLPPDKFFREQIDIYDVASKDERQSNSIVAKRAERIYSLAIDHKQNLLTKAALLGCYRKIKLGNLNKKIELDEESVNFVFSNSFYWFRNYSKALKELRRILQSSGKALLLIMNKNYLKQMQYSVFGNYPFGKLLDRGRFGQCKAFLDQNEWIDLFKKHGFKVVNSIPLMNHRLAFMADGYDLREISPVLSQLRRQMEKEKFLELKTRFIEYMHYIFCNMMADRYFDLSKGENCYNLFQIEKSNKS